MTKKSRLECHPALFCPSIAIILLLLFININHSHQLPRYNDIVIARHLGWGSYSIVFGLTSMALAWWWVVVLCVDSKKKN